MGASLHSGFDDADPATKWDIAVDGADAQEGPADLESIVIENKHPAHVSQDVRSTHSDAAVPAADGSHLAHLLTTPDDASASILNVRDSHECHSANATFKGKIPDRRHHFAGQVDTHQDVNGEGRVIVTDTVTDIEIGEAMCDAADSARK